MTSKQWQVFCWVSILWFGLIVVAHYYIDFPATYFVRDYFAPNSSFIGFVHIWSDIGYGWPYLVLFFLLFLWGKFIVKKPGFTMMSVYLWFCVAVSGLICDILKLIFGRPRPSLLFNHQESAFVFFGHRQFSGSYASFPSGHATTVMAVATGIFLLFPRWRVPCILVALSVAAARVLLLRHFVADVMAGLYVGAVTSYFLYRFMATRFGLLSVQRASV